MVNTTVFETHTALLLEKNPTLRFFFISAPYLEQKRDPLQKEQLSIVEGVKNLVCYGANLAFFESELLPFLNQSPDAYVFFIEDDRAQLEKVLSQERARALVEHERVHVLAGELGQVIYEQTASHLLFKSWQLVTPFLGVEMQMQDLSCGIKKAIKEMELEVGAYSQYGTIQAAQTASVLKHASNWDKQLLWGPSLWGSCKEAVAVVCGAGPGLKEAISWLHGVQESATIIAAGSAVKMLKEVDIDPDLAAVIDPRPIDSRYDMIGQTPLLFQLGASAKVVDSCTGPKVVCGQSELWGFERMVCDVLNWPEQTVSSGWHVGNFATHMAANLGFDKVILVGLEGCGVGEAEYGFSVEKAAENVMIEEGVNFLGQRVSTKGDFLKGAKWLEQLIEEKPQTQFFSFSDKGLFVKGCALFDKESSLFEGAKKVDIGKLLSVCERLTVRRGAAEKVLEHLSKSLDTCEKSAKGLIKLYEKGVFGYSYLEAILETEPAFDYLIGPLWQVFKPLMVAKAQGLVEEEEEKVQKALFAMDVIDTYKRAILAGVKHLTCSDNMR